MTADARGYIEPCGCEKGQFGGLPRRGTLFREARRPQDLAIDLGNFAAGQRPLDRLKLRYMLEGLEALRYDALVPGEGELALEEDFEKTALALKGPKVVCANLFRAKDGTRVFDPWTVRTLADGRRIAVVGLTSPFGSVPPGYRVGPVEASLREVLAALRGKTDAVVVAAYLEGKPALDLAAAFPAVAVVLAGNVPRGSKEVMRQRGAPSMFASEVAQYVAWVDFGADLAVSVGGQAWLGDTVPDEPRMKELVVRYKNEARALGEVLARDTVASFKVEGRVGSQACAQCHQGEYEAWTRSPHARSMETLTERGEQSNAECLPCHLQDLPPGTAAGPMAGSSVGCEACHGAGARHLEAMRDTAGKCRPFGNDCRIAVAV